MRTSACSRYNFHAHTQTRTHTNERAVRIERFSLYHFRNDKFDFSVVLFLSCVTFSLELSRWLAHSNADNFCLQIKNMSHMSHANRSSFTPFRQIGTLLRLLLAQEYIGVAPGILSSFSGCWHHTAESLSENAAEQENDSTLSNVWQNRRPNWMKEQADSSVRSNFTGQSF